MGAVETAWAVWQEQPGVLLLCLFASVITVLVIAMLVTGANRGMRSFSEFLNNDPPVEVLLPQDERRP